ncbi:MAG: hypothetical protein QM778_06075 [Myxococcales bacterium]
MVTQQWARAGRGVLVGALLALGCAMNAASAHADGLICSALAASSAGASEPPATATGFAFVRSYNLYRTQARPWAQIPTGAALVLRAPEHTTESDLHNALRGCAKQANATSPLCVKGSSFRVRADGELYVVEITGKDRASALEIQHRAANLRR